METETITLEVFKKFTKLIQEHVGKKIYLNLCVNKDICAAKRGRFKDCCYKSKEWIAYNLSEDLNLQPPNLDCPEFNS
jgi:hypothetical protein